MTQGNWIEVTIAGSTIPRLVNLDHILFIDRCTKPDGAAILVFAPHRYNRASEGNNETFEYEYLLLDMSYEFLMMKLTGRSPDA